MLRTCTLRWSNRPPCAGGLPLPRQRDGGAVRRSRGRSPPARGVVLGRPARAPSPAPDGADPAGGGRRLRLGARGGVARAQSARAGVASGTTADSEEVPVYLRVDGSPRSPGSERRPPGPAGERRRPLRPLLGQCPGRTRGRRAEPGAAPRLRGRRSAREPGRSRPGVPGRCAGSRSPPRPADPHLEREPAAVAQVQGELCLRRDEAATPWPSNGPGSCRPSWRPWTGWCRSRRSPPSSRSASTLPGGRRAC